MVGRQIQGLFLYFTDVVWQRLGMLVSVSNPITVLLVVTVTIQWHGMYQNVYHLKLSDLVPWRCCG